MQFWRTLKRRVSRRRRRPLEVETVEGRVLLSTVAVRPPQPAADRQAAALARRQSHAAHLAQVKEAEAANSQKAAASAVAPKVVEGGKYAVADAWNGYWLVHSRNVGKVGVNYAKLSVSHNTRKVAGAYISAAFKGDGKTLSQLGDTHVVKQVGDSFSGLSTSPGVKYVGRQFTDFGKLVAKQYHKMIH